MPVSPAPNKPNPQQQQQQQQQPNAQGGTETQPTILWQCNL